MAHPFRAILNPNGEEAAAREYPSGEHWIVELITDTSADPPLRPGEYTIQVGAVTDFATFNLRIDIERKGEQMAEEALIVRPRPCHCSCKRHIDTACHCLCFIPHWCHALHLHDPSVWAPAGFCMQCGSACFMSQMAAAPCVVRRVPCGQPCSVNMPSSQAAPACANGTGAHVQTLRQIADACCPRDSPCIGILQDVANGNSNSLCDEPGTHCNGKGHLTHVDLSSSNMQCPLIDILRPLAQLETIEDVQLSGNQDVTGAIDDDATLRQIENWHRLQVRRSWA